MTTLWDELYPDYVLDVFLEELQARIRSLEPSCAIDTADETYGRPFLFYLLFTHWPSLLDLTPSQAFYNRYYWFRRFMEAYQAKMGAEAGLAQQAFQMLEQAPIDLDWEAVSLVEEWAKDPGPSKANPEVFWIQLVGRGRLGIMARPRGGDWLGDEIQGLAKAGLDVLVSLLARDEVAELELEDEERICGDSGIRFVSFPIPDRGVPFSVPDTELIVGLILEELRAGKAVAVHCRMGIGRSALIAACLLKARGIGVDEAFAIISRARGFSVPDTQEQRDWVMRFRA